MEPDAYYIQLCNPVNIPQCSSKVKYLGYSNLTGQADMEQYLVYCNLTGQTAMEQYLGYCNLTGQADMVQYLGYCNLNRQAGIWQLKSSGFPFKAGWICESRGSLSPPFNALSEDSILRIYWAFFLFFGVVFFTMSIVVSPVASEAASPMITSVTPTLELSLDEEQHRGGGSGEDRGPDHQCSYQKPPPLHTGADWKVVLHLPEIETWLRATADRVRDLTHSVQQDSLNKHVDVHLVQLKDICEDISDHVEQIHALLETEFSLKLLSYSVNIIVDIRSVQLLWHQLRVSVLVLKERLLQSLQDSNGNYTRHTDILQAFSQDHDQARLDSLTEVDDSGQLTIKCSRDYFSLDCGITAYELSDYSPGEEQEDKETTQDPHTLYPEPECDFPELPCGVDVITTTASEQNQESSPPAEEPDASARGSVEPCGGSALTAEPMQGSRAWAEGSPSLTKCPVQGTCSGTPSPTQPSLPKKPMFASPTALPYQADISRSTPSLLDLPDRSKFWLELESMYPSNGSQSDENLHLMNRKNLQANEQKPPDARISLYRSSSEASQERGAAYPDPQPGLKATRPDAMQAGGDSSSPVPSSEEDISDLDARGGSSSPDNQPLPREVSLTSQPTRSPRGECWYGSEEFLALPAQLRQTELLALKLESLAKCLPPRALDQPPIQDVDDWELTEASSEWEGSPHPLPTQSYRKGPTGGRFSSSSSEVAASLDGSIESGPLSDLPSEDEGGWSSSECQRMAQRAGQPETCTMVQLCTPLIQQLLEDIQHQENYQDVWGKIEVFVSKLDEFICWLREALETTENWTPPRADAASLYRYLETHLRAACSSPSPDERSLSGYYNPLSSSLNSSEAPSTSAHHSIWSFNFHHSRTPPNQSPDPTTTPPNQSPDTTATPPNQSPDPTTTPPNQSPDTTATPPNQSPDPTTTPPNQSPDTTTTPPNQSPDPTTTPPNQSPDTTATPPNQSPDTTATPPNQSPDPTTTPPNQSPDTTATPPNQSPDPTTTPANQSPDTTATPPNQSPDTTATPPNQSPGTSAPPPNQFPDTSATPPNQSPDTSTTPPNQSPGTSATPPSQFPGTTATPPNQSPDTTATPPNQSPGTSATPPNQFPDTTTVNALLETSFKLTVDSHRALRDSLLEEGRQLLGLITSHTSGLQDILQMIVDQWWELQRQVQRQHGWLMRALDGIRANTLAINSTHTPLEPEEPGPVSSPPAQLLSTPQPPPPPKLCLSFSPSSNLPALCSQSRAGVKAFKQPEMFLKGKGKSRQPAVVLWRRAWAMGRCVNAKVGVKAQVQRCHGESQRDTVDQMRVRLQSQQYRCSSRGNTGNFLMSTFNSLRYLAGDLSIQNYCSEAVSVQGDAACPPHHVSLFTLRVRLTMFHSLRCVSASPCFTLYAACPPHHVTLRVRLTMLRCVSASPCFTLYAACPLHHVSLFTLRVRLTMFHSLRCVSTSPCFTLYAACPPHHVTLRVRLTMLRCVSASPCFTLYVACPLHHVSLFTLRVCLTMFRSLRCVSASPCFTLYAACPPHHVSLFTLRVRLTMLRCVSASPCFTLYAACPLHHVSLFTLRVRLTMFRSLRCVSASPCFTLYAACPPHHVSLFTLRVRLTMFRSLRCVSASPCFAFYAACPPHDVSLFTLRVRLTMFRSLRCVSASPCFALYAACPPHHVSLFTLRVRLTMFRSLRCVSASPCFALYAACPPHHVSLFTLRVRLTMFRSLRCVSASPCFALYAACPPHHVSLFTLRVRLTMFHSLRCMSASPCFTLYAALSEFETEYQELWDWLMDMESTVTDSQELMMSEEQRRHLCKELGQDRAGLGRAQDPGQDRAGQLRAQDPGTQGRTEQDSSELRTRGRTEWNGSELRTQGRTERHSSELRTQGRIEQDSSELRTQGRTERNGSELRTQGRTERDSSELRTQGRTERDSSGLRVGQSGTAQSSGLKAGQSRTTQSSGPRAGQLRAQDPRQDRAGQLRAEDPRQDRKGQLRAQDPGQNRAGQLRAQDSCQPVRLSCPSFRYPSALLINNVGNCVEMTMWLPKKMQLLGWAESLKRSGTELPADFEERINALRSKWEELEKTLGDCVEQGQGAAGAYGLLSPGTSSMVSQLERKVKELKTWLRDTELLIFNVNLRTDVPHPNRARESHSTQRDHPQNLRREPGPHPEPNPQPGPESDPEPDPEHDARSDRPAAEQVENFKDKQSSQAALNDRSGARVRACKCSGLLSASVSTLLALCREVRARRKGMASVLRLCQHLLDGPRDQSSESERQSLQLLQVNLQRRWEAIITQALHWRSRLQCSLGREQVPESLIDPSLIDLRGPSEDSWEWDEIDMTIVHAESQDEASPPSEMRLEHGSGRLNSAESSPTPLAAGTEVPESSRVYQVFCLHEVELLPHPQCDPNIERSKGKQALLKRPSKDSSFSSAESLPDVVAGLLSGRAGQVREASGRSESESGIVSEGDTETTGNSEACLLYQSDDGSFQASFAPNAKEQSPCADRVSDEDIDRILERAKKCAELESCVAEETKDQRYHLVRRRREECGERWRKSRKEPLTAVNGYCFSPENQDERAGADDGRKALPEHAQPSRGSSLDSLCAAGELFPSAKDALTRSTSLESWQAPQESPEEAGNQGCTGALAVASEPSAELSGRTLELLKRLENIRSPLEHKLTRSISDISLLGGSLRPPPGHRSRRAAPSSERKQGRGRQPPDETEASVSMVVNVSCTSACTDDEDDSDLLSSSTLTLTEEELGIKDEEDSSVSSEEYMESSFALGLDYMKGEFQGWRTPRSQNRDKNEGDLGDELQCGALSRESPSPRSGGGEQPFLNRAALRLLEADRHAQNGGPGTQGPVHGRADATRSYISRFVDDVENGNVESSHVREKDEDDDQLLREEGSLFTKTGESLKGHYGADALNADARGLAMAASPSPCEPVGSRSKESTLEGQLQGELPCHSSRRLSLSPYPPDESSAPHPAAPPPAEEEKGDDVHAFVMEIVDMTSVTRKTKEAETEPPREASCPASVSQIREKVLEHSRRPIRLRKGDFYSYLSLSSHDSDCGEVVARPDKSSTPVLSRTPEIHDEEPLFEVCTEEVYLGPPLCYSMSISRRPTRRSTKLIDPFCPPSQAPPPACDEYQKAHGISPGSVAGSQPQSHNEAPYLNPLPCVGVTERRQAGGSRRPQGSATRPPHRQLISSEEWREEQASGQGSY
ncbi:hypothetical protein P4O66_011755 [Electrophorus voltai]|uniref:A kinase (PRKA) anchor protein 6 n=1 Tax=Electrophorus voltai TaxID=2609070 RepID=A0AAD8Z6C0_9TELE|nr:hypothetical protein P4O66_011755 [Electrophorus voltai]